MGTHTLASQSMTAQWLGSPAVSVCSSIWYYLALIELSSIPSLSPPSALLLSSLPLLPARDGWRQRWGVPNPLCVHCSVYPDTSISSLSADQFQYSCFQVFSLLFYLPITSAISLFLFTLHLLSSLFHPSPPASFFLFRCSPCLSLSFAFILSLPHSIVNFNLRAGLNGTIRERSMLLI